MLRRSLCNLSSITHQSTNYIKLSGWSLSVAIVANSAYDSLTKELGSSYSSPQLSAASEIEAFVQSAHDYSIPAEVTEVQVDTAFFSKRGWYDALLTGARAFKESQVLDQFSIVSAVIAAGATTTISTGATVTCGVVPIAHAFLDGKFGAIAAAAALLCKGVSRRWRRRTGR
jgi:hypothetical protein